MYAYIYICMYTRARADVIFQYADAEELQFDDDAYDLVSVSACRCVCVYICVCVVSQS
jgi:hypothetical protein